MKGYCYLDVDAKIHYKPKEYIDIDNPLFWQYNDAFILRVWPFDTENLSSMLTMYKGFKLLKLKTADVNDFSASINFDISTLREYANSL